MPTFVFEPPATRAPPPKPPATVRDYISFSAIKTYQQCPLRYFFKYIAGLPEESVAAAFVFGSAIHHAVQHHFQQLLEGQPAPTVDELLAQYQLGWNDRTAGIRFSKDERTDSFDQLAQRMLRTFAQSDLAQPAGRVLAVEETLRGSIIPGLPDVLGRVDLIVETADELVVNDWKTSRSRFTAEQVEESASQLLLYGELARDFAPGKPVRLEFGVFTKTKEVVIDRHSLALNPAQLDRTKRIVERVWNAIQAEHFYPVPSTMNCSGCPFREPCRKWCG